MASAFIILGGIKESAVAPPAVLAAKLKKFLRLIVFISSLTWLKGRSAWRVAAADYLLKKHW